MRTRRQEAVDRLDEAEHEVDRLTEKLIGAVGDWYHKGDDQALVVAFKLLVAARRAEEDAVEALMKHAYGEK